MVRSESCHAIMLVDSGMSEMKSQKLSCADCPVGISLKPLSGLEDQGGQRRLYENLGEGRERRGEASLHCVYQVWEFHAFLGGSEASGDCRRRMREAGETGPTILDETEAGRKAGTVSVMKILV